MKKVLLTISLFLLGLGTIYSQSVVSTTSGGEWADTTTWVGHVIPTATDDVVIDGPVYANSTGLYGITLECNNLTINTGDTLTCNNFGSYGVLIFVNGDIINNGTITQSDYPFSSSSFGISVKGDVVNNGDLRNNYITFSGESAQTLTSNSQIEVHSIEMKNGQNLIAGSDLSFVDTYFQFNNGDFVIGKDFTVSFYSTEGGTGNGGGHVDKAHFTGGGKIFSAGISSNDVYWFNDSTTVENIKLTGIIRGKGEFAILGGVVNEDTLQQAEHNYPVNIYVKEDFVNEGIVRDNPFDNDYLVMVVEKNISNEGSWISSWTVMDGTSDQLFTNKGELFSSFKFAANVAGATTFQWYKDGSAISEATNETYEYYYDTSNPQDYNPYGEYYCQTNNGNSRKITIKNANGGGGTGTILSENFDGNTFPPASWTQTINNSSYTWIAGNPQSHSFTNIDPANVHSAICPWVGENQDEWLITPSLSFPDNGISLQFYAGFSTAWLTSATLKLHVSTDGGSNWNEVWEANNDGSDWKWHEISVDLSEYANKTNVLIGWQYVGNNGDLVAIDNINVNAGVVEVEDKITKMPVKYLLGQNYPNPFNPTTTISYQLPEKAFVSLEIYNLLGQKVADLVNQIQAPGNHKVNFNASKLSSGTYIYRMKAGNFIMSKKMLLLK